MMLLAFEGRAMPAVLAVVLPLELERRRVRPPAAVALIVVAVVVAVVVVVGLSVLRAGGGFSFFSEFAAKLKIRCSCLFVISTPSIFSEIARSPQSR